MGDDVGSRVLRIASVAFLLATSAAHAHVAPPLIRADRTLTITLGERVTLAYVVRLSNPELSRVRRDGDVDHDGTLSRAEADKVLATFTSALHEGVRYASGRDALGPHGRLAAAYPMSSEATGLEGPVQLPERGPGARLAWQFDLRLARGDDRLAIDDGAAFVQFDHSDVIVRDTATRKLLGLGDDPSRMRPQPELSWVDAGSAPRHTVHLTWTPGKEAARGLMLMLVIVVGIAIAGATLWSVRDRRPRDRETRNKEPQEPPQ